MPEGKFDDVDTLPMFDMDPTPVVEAPRVSPDERRTVRQRDAVRRGLHPLALVFPLIRRHPGTIGETYTAGDERARDLTCGSCRFRDLQDHHGRRYAKCWKDGDRRATSGAATDVRAWWPACTSWEARP